MTKRSLYKKLVCQFESTINNYQTVNAKFDFDKFEKIISNHKDNDYYEDIGQFLDYLRAYRHQSALIYIFPEFRKKYQRLLEKVETLLTARPFEASRQIRSTNNCENPYGDQYNERLVARMYQNDLENSPGFSKILNRYQLIEFWFKDTVFVLSKDCIRRQDLAGNPQSLSEYDYRWFIQSMDIPCIENIVREEAQEQGLIFNKAYSEQIIQEFCRIDTAQQNARQLMGIYSQHSRLDINKSELAKFFFNSNSSNLSPHLRGAVRLKITALKNLEPKEPLEPEASNAFTLPNSNHNPRPLSETQSIATSMRPNDYRAAEGFNWMIIVPVAVGGIGIIVFIVAILFWYSKKNRSGNSEINMELCPLLNSMQDSLHVREIAGRLTKRLESLKKLDRYEDEIGVHYISFITVVSNEDVIKALKKIKTALTKFLNPKGSSNKDKITSYKLVSALINVETLMQCYNLLSLTNTIKSKHNYLEDFHISGLRKLISSMIFSIEFIRDSYKKSGNIPEFVNCEKVAGDANLIAHAEGFFEKNPLKQVMQCLELEKTKPNTEDNHKSELEKIQDNLVSSLKIIIDSFKKLKDAFLILGKIKLSNVPDSIIIQSEAIKSQLAHHFADGNARRDMASKLQNQTQASIPSVNSTFFEQPPSPEIIQPTQEYTMHR